MQKQEDRQYAGFFVRLAAYFVDYLAAAILLMFTIVPMGVVNLMAGNDMLHKPVLFEYSIAAILIYLIRIFYFTICTYSGGQTIGKKIFNICVVSAGEEELTFLNVLYRETIGRFLSGLVLNIGYLMIGPGREKCALHDILCDTRVIYSVYVRGMKGKARTKAGMKPDEGSREDRNPYPPEKMPGMSGEWSFGQDETRESGRNEE